MPQHISQSTQHNESKAVPIVLTIAGSDPSGGAGIQGDIKSIEANGAFAMSVLTAITAQNSVRFSSAIDLPIWMIESQFTTLIQDFKLSGIKTGMLSSKRIVKSIAKLLKKNPIPNFVLDPVMQSKDGTHLLNPEAIEALKKELIPLSTLLTPNIPEAEQLIGKNIRTLSEVEEAAKTIFKLGCRAVLIKGGHLLQSPGSDILFDGEKIQHFKGEFIQTSNTHGTGCTYASAIAAHLARGETLETAISTAKHYVTEAIRYSISIGKGQGPTNHFYFLKTRDHKE